MSSCSKDYLVCVSQSADDEFLAALAKLDAGIELQSYGLNGVLSPKNWDTSLESHREILERFAGPRAVHGPFLGLLYNYQDHILRDAVRQRMDLTFELVRQLEPQTLVLHTNWRLDLPALGLNGLWLDQNVEFWRREIARYEEVGTRVVLENVLEPDPRLMVELCDRVDSSHFGLCLDVGHVNVWSTLPPQEWIQRMGARLLHVHLHDNHGGADEHLSIGEGTIDFDAVFNALEQNVPEVTIAIEVDASLDDRLTNLRLVKSRYA